jgi:uncharacterized YccA/Bax inhibitor family protein
MSNLVDNQSNMYAEQRSENVKPLAVIFAIGGVWDTIAGLLFLFLIGNGRAITSPATDPFYAVFLGSFFLCFAWIQFVSSTNIKKYAVNIGCLVFGRILYVVLLYYSMLFIEGFPSTFWFTGIIDSLLVVAYFIAARIGKLNFRLLFIPGKE